MAKSNTVNKNTRSSASKKPKAKSRGTRRNALENFFSFSNLNSNARESSKNNFSTSFVYRNFSFKINSEVKGGTITLYLKISGKKFNFNGVISLNESAFSEIQTIFNHVFSNMSKLR